MQSQEKSSNEGIIKKEKDNIASIESTESVPVHFPEVMDHLDEERINDQESISYCVKTKPYYSINAKLNQREKVSASTNIPTNKYIDKGYSEIGVEEVAPVIEDHITPVDEIKPPSIWDATFKFLATSTQAKTSQTYNKSNVTCLICGKQLSNQYNLRVHMETHSNSSYSCAACPHVSRSRDALRKHVSYRHPVASQKRPRYSASKP